MRYDQGGPHPGVGKGKCALLVRIGWLVPKFYPLCAFHWLYNEGSMRLTCDEIVTDM